MLSRGAIPARKFRGEGGELGSDVICSAMVQVGKKIPGLFPGLARFPGLACGLVGISEMIEDGGLEGPVCEFPGQGACALAAGYCLPVLAEAMMRQS